MLSDFEESVIKSSENALNKDYEITIASSFLSNFYFQLDVPLVLCPDYGISATSWFHETDTTTVIGDKPRRCSA